MLILTRRCGEIIDIFTTSGHVTVQVTKINRDNGMVKLGITAPRDVTILRREVALRDEKERQNGISEG